jgi:hypothetical protein
VTIPLHGGREIGPPLFFKILRQLGLSQEEFQLIQCFPGAPCATQVRSRFRLTRTGITGRETTADIRVDARRRGIGVLL